MIILNLPNTSQTELDRIAIQYANQHRYAQKMLDVAPTEELRGYWSGVVWITEFTMRLTAMNAATSGGNTY